MFRLLKVNRVTDQPMSYTVFSVYSEVTKYDLFMHVMKMSTWHSKPRLW